MLNVPAEARIDLGDRHARWRTFRHGQPVPLDRQPIARACLQGEVVHNEELELVFAGGRQVSVLMSASPVRDREGAIIGAVAGWADVSQLTTLQRELDARRREAEESSARKSRFLAAVSHDIRTPANAISLLAELMQRSATTPGMIGEIPEIAVDLKRSALTLVDLVSDVLDLTRFDCGKVELQESIVSLGDLLDEDCRQLQQTAREKGLEFNCRPPAGPIRIRTDRVKLSRVLTNLISNAIKFTERGKIEVRAEPTPDGGAAIHVTDTGCGIPPEHFERIFDEFFQLKNSERDRSHGSGLGLAICRRLVDAMGGSITVTSELGHGSTFTVRVPATSVVPA
jgi:signal transduction histidine kinase